MSLYIKFLCWLHELGLISDRRFCQLLKEYETNCWNRITVIDV